MGARGGDVGTLAGKESILNPSCSSREGTQSFTPALSPEGTRTRREGWMHPLLPAIPGKAKHGQFSPFSCLFFFFLFDSPMPAPSSLPAHQHVSRFILPLGTSSNWGQWSGPPEGPARWRAGHVPNPKKQCRGWGVCGGVTTPGTPTQRHAASGHRRSLASPRNAGSGPTSSRHSHPARAPYFWPGSW